MGSWLRCVQGSAWQLVQRTAQHPRYAELYTFPSYEDSWHRVPRCATLRAAVHCTQGVGLAPRLQGSVLRPDPCRERWRGARMLCP